MLLKLSNDYFKIICSCIVFSSILGTASIYAFTQEGMMEDLRKGMDQMVNLNSNDETKDQQPVKVAIKNKDNRLSQSERNKYIRRLEELERLQSKYLNNQSQDNANDSLSDRYGNRESRRNSGVALRRISEEIRDIKAKLANDDQNGQFERGRIEQENRRSRLEELERQRQEYENNQPQDNSDDSLSVRYGNRETRRDSEVGQRRVNEKIREISAQRNEENGNGDVANQEQETIQSETERAQGINTSNNEVNNAPATIGDKLNEREERINREKPKVKKEIQTASRRKQNLIRRPIKSVNRQPNGQEVIDKRLGFKKNIEAPSTQVNTIDIPIKITKELNVMQNMINILLEKLRMISLENNKKKSQDASERINSATGNVNDQENSREDIDEPESFLDAL